MHLSNAEKLILMMLCDLHEKFGIEGHVEPEFIRSAIYSDNAWGIPLKYRGIPFEEEPRSPVVGEVLDILEMWRSIESAYRRLPDAEKRKVDEELGPFGPPKFQGFDGNNEGKYLNVAEFLMNDLEQFDVFSGRELNTHHPVMDEYRKMVPAYKRFRGELTFGAHLTGDQIISIHKERLHPDYR